MNTEFNLYLSLRGGGQPGIIVKLVFEIAVLPSKLVPTTKLLWASYIKFHPDLSINAKLTTVCGLYSERTV